MKELTFNLIWIAHKTQGHWPKIGCASIRRDVARDVREYRRLNPNNLRGVRRAYARGDALYGDM